MMSLRIQRVAGVVLGLCGTCGLGMAQQDVDGQMHAQVLQMTGAGVYGVAGLRLDNDISKNMGGQLSQIHEELQSRHGETVGSGQAVSVGGFKLWWKSDVLFLQRDFDYNQQEGRYAVKNQGRVSTLKLEFFEANETEVARSHFLQRDLPGLCKEVFGKDSTECRSY